MWTPFVFIRFVFWLILGIITYLVFEPQFNFWIEFFGVLVLVYAVLLQKSKNISQNSRLLDVLGIFGFLIIFIFGIALTDIRTPSQNPTHLLHFPDSITHFEAILTSDLVSKPNSLKAEAQIIRVKSDSQWNKVDGNIIIYFQKSIHFPNFCYGTKVIISGFPKIIKPPSNPEEFDYQQYLKRKGIYHQIYVPKNFVQKIGFAPPNFIINLAMKIRRISSQKLRKYIKNPRSASVAEALILGIKDGIDNELRETYASAGVMHILAVSGLHVGILFTLFSSLLGRLNRTKKGKLIFAFLATLFLFLYALITGFSPSVVRAVVMFSCVAWAKAIERTPSTYNTIAFSAFVMLCYDPYFLTQVGFQLSYLAVIGIVFFYSKIYFLWTPPNYLTRVLWQLIVVSICAQITVTPLSLLYFNQFPVYFLLANTLIIPLIPVLIGLGLTLLSVSIFDFFTTILADLLGNILSLVIDFMNYILLIIAQLPNHLIENISISVFEMFLLYGIIIGITCLFLFRIFWINYLIISFLIMFFGLNLYTYLAHGNQKEVMVYDIKSSNVAFLDGHKGILIADSITIHDKKQFERHIKKHWQTKNIRSVEFISFESKESNKYIFYAKFNQKFVLVNHKKWKGNLNKLPDADVLIINSKYNYLFKKLNKTKFKEVIITNVKLYHDRQKIKKMLAEKCKKITFISQNQYFKY